MKFYKFPKTGVVARGYSDRLVFRMQYDVDSLHDFSKESLLDDICFALIGSYSLCEMTMVIIGQESTQSEVWLEIDGVFNKADTDPDNQPVEIAIGEAGAYFAKLFKWSKIEEIHAFDTLDRQYDVETIVKTVGGRAIHAASPTECCAYVRIVDFGFELAYWAADEWSNDPQVVMGAMLALASGKK